MESALVPSLFLSDNLAHPLTHKEKNKGLKQLIILSRIIKWLY